MKYEHLRIPALVDEATINRLGNEGWQITAAYDNAQMPWLVFVRPGPPDEQVMAVDPVDEQPIFVLKGNDMFAPELVRAWAERARMIGVNQDKIARAEAVYTAMCDWQKERGSKVPD